MALRLSIHEHVIGFRMLDRRRFVYIVVFTMSLAARKRPEPPPDASELIPFAFRIERGIIAGLDEMVEDLRQEHPSFRRISRSDVIRDALREAIERHRAGKG